MNKTNCQCCNNPTIEESGNFEICPLCFWEDDPVQNKNSSLEFGANRVSLQTAKRNYKMFGVSDYREKNYVRQVKKYE